MNSTYEIIANSAARVPEQVALRFLPKGDPTAVAATYRYRQLHQQVTRFANWLHANGVGTDDAVSIVLPNLPQFHFAFWGAEAAAIANPINPLLEAEHMRAIMRTVKTRVLVTLAPDAPEKLWPKIEAVAVGVPSLERILTVDSAMFSSAESTPAPPSRLGSIVVEDFDAAIALQPGERLLSERTFSPADIAAYFHTGGTTGIPKVARHTHGNEIAMAQALATELELDDSGRFLCGLPLFHVNGVMVTGLAPFLVGASVLILTAAGYRGEGVIKNFWKLIERYGINYFSGVPTVYSSLLEVPIGDADVSSLRYGICGAAPLSPETMRQFEAATGIRLLEGYGLTEAACASTLNPPRGERRVGSIGRAFPGIEVKTVEIDAAGRPAGDCADEVVGQIVIRGPTVFPGYLDEANNAGVFLPGGWLKTGDLGRRDADGYFWLAGRAKDLIIRGGHNIDPAVIEEALLKHPAVALAAAVGRPDRHSGEVPVAYVECRQGQSVTEAELMQHANALISERAALPKSIQIIERIPLTAVGKVFKPALVWRETQAVFAGALSAVEGIASFTVEVGADPRLGTIAHVALSPAAGVDRDALASAVNSALGAFTTRYVLEEDEAGRLQHA